MQKTGAGMAWASSCIWDEETDGNCTVRWENDSMYCIVNVFGLAIWAIFLVTIIRNYLHIIINKRYQLFITHLCFIFSYKIQSACVIRSKMYIPSMPMKGGWEVPTSAALYLSFLSRCVWTFHSKNVIHSCKLIIEWNHDGNSKRK